MRRAVKHFKKWNEWRKRSINSRLHKALVLLCIVRSPTFTLFIPSEEWKDMMQTALNGEPTVSAPK